MGEERESLELQIEAAENEGMAVYPTDEGEE